MNRCITDISKIIALAFDEFTENVSTKNKALGKKMLEQAEAKCFNGMRKPVKKPSDLNTYFQCLADSMGKAWVSNGYDKLWSKYQHNLQLHLDNWKKCPNAGDSNAVEL